MSVYSVERNISEILTSPQQLITFSSGRCHFNTFEQNYFSFSLLLWRFSIVILGYEPLSFDSKDHNAVHKRNGNLQEIKLLIVQSHYSECSSNQPRLIQTSYLWELVFCCGNVSSSEKVQRPTSP